MRKKTFFIFLMLFSLFSGLVMLFLFKPNLFITGATKNMPEIIASQSDDMQKTSKSFFEIKKVEIEGETPFVSQQSIRDTLMKYVKKNFFDINLAKTIDALSILPGIKSVSIRKVWPDKLVVYLESETAFAKSISANWLINPKGELFETQIPYNKQLAVFQSPAGEMGQVVGFYKNVKIIVKDKALSKDLFVDKVILSGSGDWELNIMPLNKKYVKEEKEFTLQLGHRSVEKRLNNILEIYKSGKFLDKEGESPRLINLQYQSGFSVQWYS